MPKFVVECGASPGTEIPMGASRLLFGRAEDCDVVVADANVSRHHTQAVVLDDMVAVVDLNSSNGTFVNELPISRTFLMNGDRLRFGETVLVYVDERAGGYDPGMAAGVSSPRWQTPGPATETPAGGDSPLTQIDQTRMFAAISEVVRLDALKDIYLKLKALYRVFVEVAQAPSLKEIFEAVGRAIIVSVNAERVLFFLNAEKTGGTWEQFHQQCASRLDPRMASHPPLQELLDRTRDEQRTCMARADEQGRCDIASTEPNVVAVPLLRGRKLAALIYVDNPSSLAPLTKNDLDFVATLGLQVGVRLNQFEQVQQLRQENVQLRQRADEDFAIVVQNERMRQLMAVTERVAESESTVMITGESGTGKELIARSIHRFSRRGGKPLVTVNCAALPDTLLESELFGHEKGAFTGAVERHIGKFELADGGTLFLDEIGDISAPAQAKILRAVQEGEIQRIGGNKTIKVNVRLIVATNKDLREEVRAGNFREDLFFRIKVIEIDLPALRDRRDDVPALAEYFLKQLRQKCPTTVRRFSADAMEALKRYPFPGNVRELRNVVERGLVFAHGEEILPEHLPMEIFQQLGSPVSDAVHAGSSAGGDGEPLSLAEVEKRHIESVLRYVKGNKVRAASLLGISRTTLYEKLKVYGLGEGKE